MCKSKTDILTEYIKSAYKKLKSYSYYDNKNMFLKNRIVDFENSNVENETSTDLLKCIDEKFYRVKEIIEGREKVNFNFINCNKLNENSLIEAGNFTIRSVPKSITDDKCKNKTISNFVKKDSKANVDKVMYYLDLDIISQIIGTMWVMIIGKDLEKIYGKYTEGNVLDEDINKDNLKLFKPYYLSYERWRDDAIKIVEDRINNNSRSTMVSLDIKEYYYSINLDIEKDKSEIFEIFKSKRNKNKITEEVFSIINDYVFNIIKKYSEIMNIKSYSKNEENNFSNILPIGFLPSSILSNWYLHKFDKEVNKILSPLYYKRYVDDILIILNTDYNEENDLKEEEDILNDKFYDNGLFEVGVLINNKDCDSENIIVLSDIDKFIEFTSKIALKDIELKDSILGILNKILRESVNDEKSKEFIEFKEEDSLLDWSKKNPITEKCTEKEIKDVLEKNIKNINKKLKIDSKNLKKIYLIKQYIENTYLIIQDEKVKVYDFVSGGSKALVENFKNEIVKNLSVFKFLPQKDEVLNSFDSEVYKVEYKDSIHKLSSIESIKINRYNLSKFLARIIYSDKLENDNYTSDVDEKILGIFNGEYAIEYFFLWDKVFNYYLINKKYSRIKELFINIYAAIDNLECEKADFSFVDISEKVSSECSLKVSLKSYLKFVLSMNYALDDGIFINYLNSKEENAINLEVIYKKFDECIADFFKSKIEEENNIEIIKLDNLKGIYTLKEKIRISNMMNHSLIKSPLMNYYYIDYKNCYINKKNIIHINFINSIVGQPEILTDRSRCFFINSNYSGCIKNRDFNNLNESSECSLVCKDNKVECFNISTKSFSAKYSPRFVHLHECILNEINNLILRGKIISEGKEIVEGKKLFNELNNIKNNLNIYSNINKILQKRDNDNEELNKLLKTHFKYFYLEDYLFTQKERNINYLEFANEVKKDKLKIGIVNMKVDDDDLINSFKKSPNIESKRLQKINKILNSAVKNGAELIVFPEVSIPVEWLGVISDFSRRHDVLIICGLEHIIYENKLCCNYIATIIPDKYNNYTYSIVKLRLKNHYSPKEKEWVIGYGWEIPSESEKWKKEYDLFRWKGIDFSTFSCFELANIKDRALLTSFVDLLVGSVHNKDVNYYSNIIESLARDIHCYVVHVNSSHLGDNRIIKPAPTVEKNILQVSGGINDVVLVGEIDIKKLRAFQIKNHNLQIEDKSFKAVPPEYKSNNVKIRDNLPL